MPFKKSYQVFFLTLNPWQNFAFTPAISFCFISIHPWCVKYNIIVRESEPIRLLEIQTTLSVCIYWMELEEIKVLKPKRTLFFLILGAWGIFQSVYWCGSRSSLCKNNLRYHHPTQTVFPWRIEALDKSGAFLSAQGPNNVYVLLHCKVEKALSEKGIQTFLWRCFQQWMGYGEFVAVVIARKSSPRHFCCSWKQTTFRSPRCSLFSWLTVQPLYSWEKWPFTNFRELWKAL